MFHRYKLLLAEHVSDTFLNIGDGSGHGQDHCELVGGTEADANLPNDFFGTPSELGNHTAKHHGKTSQFDIGYELMVLLRYILYVATPDKLLSFMSLK